MNEVAKFLRDELALVDESKRLGIYRRVEHDTALLVFRRAADEIEALDSIVTQLRLRARQPA